MYNIIILKLFGGITMKKSLALILALAMIFAAIPAFGADASISILIDGEKLVPVDAAGNPAEPFILDGTTYLPVRATATAFGLEVDWDNDTRTVIIGKKGETTLDDDISITIDGELFTAKDATGKVVYPQNVNGSVFLPIRAIAEALDKNVACDGDSKTVTITTPAAADDNEIGNKYYIITNVGTGKALATVGLSKDNSAALTTLDNEDTDDFAWRLGKMGTDTYNISNAASGKSVDVPSANMDAGQALIIYSSNGNNNQKWVFE